jgi:hypothetical protein
VDALCTLLTSSVILSLSLRLKGHPLKSTWRFPYTQHLGFCRSSEWASDGHHQGFWAVPSLRDTTKAHTVCGHIILTRGEWGEWYGLVCRRNQSWPSAVNYEWIKVPIAICGVVLSSYSCTVGMRLEWQPRISLSSLFLTFLMNSTWLPSVHTSLLITSSFAMAWWLPHHNLPPLFFKMWTGWEFPESLSLSSIWF